jgi:hypothetical protein
MDRAGEGAVRPPPFPAEPRWQFARGQPLVPDLCKIGATVRYLFQAISSLDDHAGLAP